MSRRHTVNIKLLTNASQSGDEITVDYGGRYLMIVCGTWGGATAKMQIMGPDDETFIDIPASNLSADGMALVYLPDNAVVKGVLVGGAPTGMFMTMRRCTEF